MFKTSVVLILTSVISYGCGSKAPAATDVSEPGRAAVRQVADVIATGPFEVAPRTFTPFKVVVPEGAAGAWIEGTFTASGGANDDIEVMLLDELQFLNWHNRHKFTSLYESGRVTADRIRVALPPDPATYVLVFNNRFSLLSRKGVVADLQLRYDGKP